AERVRKVGIGWCAFMGFFVCLLRSLIKKNELTYWERIAQKGGGWRRLIPFEFSTHTFLLGFATLYPTALRLTTKTVSTWLNLMVS
ncbi:MAG: hypothetical protein ACE5DR_02345, partial [Thermodesulfobacteriota bacterium]